MIEITIVQIAVIVFATVVATIIIAQPFRRKNTYMKLMPLEIKILADSILKELNEDKIAEYILGGMAMLINNITKNGVAQFPTATTKARPRRSAKFPGLVAKVNFKRVPQSKLTKKKMDSVYEAVVTTSKKRKSKPRTEAQKARAKELMRGYRAKRRAAKK